MEHFVGEHSVVREIWGKADTILLIFAGASAEFALNKAVDWLYFTGKLPADPLGRLFSTVSYARSIVFSERQAAERAIENINQTHASVEFSRGDIIPDRAYKDVLFMLIDYSIKAFETLERPLNPLEKQEVLKVFTEVGHLMNLKNLPKDMKSFKIMRHKHLHLDLVYGKLSKDLYTQYRKHLGLLRYRLFLETQILVVPKRVRQLLNLRSFSLLYPMVSIYKILRRVKLDRLLRKMILPYSYKKEIQALDKLPV